ncbi:Receptor-interacting serine/threonine-protein kinase 1 [Collichthys lucidus]|uniref:Receptor-interacting serine/threonine-protein kinase 1 n=1 Tax=Collichthys lucidus TaxID=240159 RepID=A0A4U5UWU5_COLLU|nr:Receptor-interacting serine/threonine-protein kinase 1 [Collichthys lucidus]
MASLNHERVVKLLGVIMEDRDYSLVMELMPRGNLLVMLETIADLGLATCQAWSKLTREESRRKSRKGRSVGARGAGTLSYMAPEHLESIHTPSTEKSDVYSFAIVVWVILTGEEPYQNARSEDQMSQCVRKGDRPAESLIPVDTPAEIIQMMKRCWDHCPQKRPTFKVISMQKLYDGPEDLVEKMKSLSITPECFPADCPASLVSSDRNVSVPVEASIEDLSDNHYELPEGSVEVDARGVSVLPALEEKLDRELQYHKHGSYNCENQPDAASYYHNNTSNPFLQNPCTTDYALRQPEQDRPPYVSSVHSWTKAEAVQPSSQEEALYRPTAGLYESMNTSIPTAHSLPMSASTSSLPQFNQEHPHSHFDRQQSWPTYPVSDTSAPDINPGRLLAPSKMNSLQDQGTHKDEALLQQILDLETGFMCVCFVLVPGSLFIQNASGIQIGSNNSMSIRGYDSSHSLLSHPNGSANFLIKEGILKYEDHAVTEEHLELLRENIGAKWKRCARKLGLTNVEIEDIEYGCYRDGLPEMVHQMLERWKMKEGSIGCTIGKLCRALEGNIKVDVIQKILDSCGSSP